MSAWTKLPSLGPVGTGCLNCAPKPATIAMSVDPHPGFGGCYLKRDGEDHTTYFLTIYDGDDAYRTMQDFEDIAAGDADHDWRLEIHGPLGGVVYQRHGEAEWVAVERLDGFA